VKGEQESRLLFRYNSAAQRFRVVDADPQGFL